MVKYINQWKEGFEKYIYTGRYNVEFYIVVYFLWKYKFYIEV